ncbi:uncharacterized protein SPPG_01126 [Spizellomyces punctatus DAOM BR117]|uniref:GOLD domain-containing protein n=1 Tax=Spizellomyces punctatus (strain DAOM BR117) TaxID=645134 RepID=A0A0L0HRY5_SPIPD|nr:uncharacterized protein SPPG_01126 [Spizellomyces punctatus DAOM BR117]KND03655.1 hypothetical protein SPPG_01126 [Spizellomyces punctatus DAOM BR117]|eukprot:XP_016611694.1 hypothetical protein SPPG_01126 [Spizellomyces punctatus DAOM BR117]
MRPLIAVLLVIGFTLSNVNALYFYLEGSAKKCFIEELPADTTVVGNYKSELFSESSNSYSADHENKIQISVEHLESRHVIVNQKGDPKGRFTFSTADAGEYAICFSTTSNGWFSDSSKTKLHLDLLFGDATHDNLPDAKKEALSDLALRVRELNVKVASIRREQQYQKEREVEFRNTSERANSHVRNWTLAQLLVLGVTCLWQIRHLKNFFVAKKLV